MSEQSKRYGYFERIRTKSEEKKKRNVGKFWKKL